MTALNSGRMQGRPGLGTRTSRPSHPLTHTLSNLRIHPLTHHLNPPYHLSDPISRLTRWQGLVGISRERGRAAAASSSSTPAPPFGYDPKTASQYIALWTQKLNALISSNRFASVSMFTKVSLAQFSQVAMLLTMSPWSTKYCLVT